MPQSFEQLQNTLQKLHKTKTLRQIAEEDFGGTINHAVIQRCIEGKQPQKPMIRKMLGLPLIAERTLGRDPKTGRYVSLKRSII